MITGTRLTHVGETQERRVSLRNGRRRLASHLRPKTEGAVEGRESVVEGGQAWVRLARRFASLPRPPMAQAGQAVREPDPVRTEMLVLYTGSCSWVF